MFSNSTSSSSGLQASRMLLVTVAFQSSQREQSLLHKKGNSISPVHFHSSTSKMQAEGRQSHRLPSAPAHIAPEALYKQQILHDNVSCLPGLLCFCGRPWRGLFCSAINDWDVHQTTRPLLLSALALALQALEFGERFARQLHREARPACSTLLFLAQATWRRRRCSLLRPAQ